MLEINIRTFTKSPEGGLFENYQNHRKLIHTQLENEVEAYVDEQEYLPIYQYYCASPLCLLEAKMLRRMGIGMSFAYVKQNPQSYLEKFPLPRFMKKLLERYLVYFFNQMDYIVVAKSSEEERMQEENIVQPKFYWIDDSEQFSQEIQASIWLDLYQEALERLCEIKQLEKGKMRWAK